MEIKAKYFLLEPKCGAWRQNGGRLGDVTEAGRPVLRGMEVILQILRLGDHFCGDHGAALPPFLFWCFQIMFLMLSYYTFDALLHGESIQSVEIERPSYIHYTVIYELSSYCVEEEGEGRMVTNFVYFILRVLATMCLACCFIMLDAQTIQVVRVYVTYHLLNFWLNFRPTRAFLYCVRVMLG